MSLKKPLCAVCGRSLTNTFNFRHDFLGLPTRPIVGWHTHCYVDDPLAIELVAAVQLIPRVDGDAEIEKVVGRIEQRGPGRVVRARKPPTPKAASGRE